MFFSVTTESLNINNILFIKKTDKEKYQNYVGKVTKE